MLVLSLTDMETLGSYHKVNITNIPCKHHIYWVSRGESKTFTMHVLEATLKLNV